MPRRYSGLLLCRCKVDLFAGEGVGGYGDLAATVGGPIFGAFTKFMIVINWYLLMPYYLVASGGSLAVVAPDAPVCGYIWTLMMAILIVPPMQFTTLTEVSLLCGASTAAIIIVIFLIIVQLVMDGPEGGSFGANWDAISPDLTLSGFFGGLSSFVFAYQGQDIFCEIISEMREEKDAPKAIGMSYGLMTFVYSITTVLAYGMKGRDVQGFLPDAITGGGLTQFVGVLLFFHILTAYLCIGIPFLNVMHAKFSACGCFGAIHEGSVGARVAWFILSFITVATTYLLAAAFPFFDALQVLLGSLAGAPIVFGWPAMFYLLGCRMKGVAVGCFDLIMCITYFALTLLFGILGTLHAVGYVNEMLNDPTVHVGFDCVLGGEGGE